MPGPMENRAAVFTSSPQDVEVYRAGAWWPGSLLGWRHDVDGGCQAWVRVLVGGVEETLWLALDYLRLPEPQAEARADRHLAVVATAPATAAGGIDDLALTGTMAAIRAVPVPPGRRPGSRAGSSELTATMNLFAVRDLPADATAPGASAPAGSAAGAAPTRRAGGRRRAPETAAEGPSPAEVPPAAVPGRHRAPAASGAAAGRHRAADTGVWPAIRDDDRAEPAGLPRAGAAVPRVEDSGAAPLTRPMRLGDLVGNPREGAIPQPRRVHRDGWLSEA